MPEERGYTRQVATGGAGRAVLADADAYGAVVGRAIEQGADQLHQRQLRAYKLDRQEDADAEAADVARRMAEARTRISTWELASKTGDVPGAKGHAANLQKMMEAEREALLDGVLEDSVRQRAAVQWDDFAAGNYSRAETYEAVRSADLLVANAKETERLAINRIVSSKGDRAVYGEELVQLNGLWDGLAGVPIEQREAGKRQAREAASVAFVNQQNEADPVQMLAELEAGLWDDELSPDQIAGAKRGSLIQIKAVAQEQAEAAQDARDAAREKLKLLKGRVERLESVSPKDAEAVFAEAAAAGVAPSELEEQRATYYDSRRLASYSPANDPRGDRAARRVAQLDQKRESGQALNAEEQRDYAALEGAANARAKEQGVERKELYGSGPAGAAQAIEEVATLRGRGQRFAAAQELEDGAGYVALLPSPAARKVALDGKAILKSRPKDFGETAQIDKAFSEAIGPVAPSLGASFGPMKALSWQIYAGQMNAQGLTGWSKANYQRAVRSAFGMTKRDNGALQGGVATVRGRPVLLPDDRTAEEFDAIISRIPAGKFAEGVYADGTAARKADVLGRYRPEYLGSDASGNSVYHLIGPDAKPLRMKDGRPWPISVPPRGGR